MLKITHTIGKLSSRLSAIAARTQKAVPAEVTTAIGVQAVAWGVQDYRAKARGGADETGQAWDKLKPVSIAGRMLKRKVGADLRRRLRSNAKGGSQRIRAAIMYRAITDPDFLPAFFKAFQRESKAYEIGVDTGRLVASLTFGVPDLAAIKVPSPRPEAGPPPKAIFDREANAITVGTRIVYAERFDERRPIFSPGFITAARKDSLVRTATRVYQRWLKQQIEGGSGR